MRALVVLAVVACREPAPPQGVVSIAVVFAGADAETIEQQVVVPIEHAVAALSGVRSITARIEGDHATVVLEPRGDLDRLLLDVRDALARVQTQLPSDMSPPVVMRQRRDPRPVVYLTVRSTTLSLAALADYIDWVLRPQLLTIVGVADVEPQGLGRPTFIVRPDAERLAATGTTIGDLVAALQSDLSVPAGRVDAKGAQVRVASKPANLEELGDTIVRQVNGVPVRLRDLANVHLDMERTGSPIVEERTGSPIVVVHAQVGARDAEVARAVRTAIARHAPPAGITIAEAPPPTPRPPPRLVVSLRGPDLEQLHAQADSIVAKLAGIGEVVRDPAPGKPERTFTIDRAAAARFGMSNHEIAQTLRVLAGAEVGELDDHGKRREIVVRVEPTAFDRLQLRGPRGELVPFASLVQQTLGTAPTILHVDRERAVTLSIYTQKVAAARDVVKRTALPTGYRMVVTP